MGGKWCKKNRVQEFLDSVFSRPFLPHVWDSVFFQATKVLLITLLQLFSTRVLDNHLGGLKAACIGSALTKFRPSVGDGAP